MISKWSRQQHQPPPEVAAFTLKPEGGNEPLHARCLGEQVFLTTTDGSRCIPVESTDELPFADVAIDPRIAFEFHDGVWQTVIRDPRVRPSEEF